MTSPADVVSAVAPDLTERQAFEQWFSDDGQSPRAVERSGEGYRLQAAQMAWVAWQACASARAWQEPHVGADEQGNATLEWWHGDRKITMYPMDGMLMKVWGPNCTTEMDEVSLEDHKATRAAFNWLATSPEANRGAPAGATAETPPKDQS